MKIEAGGNMEGNQGLRIGSISSRVDEYDPDNNEASRAYSSACSTTYCLLTASNPEPCWTMLCPKVLRSIARKKMNWKYCMSNRERQCLEVARCIWNQMIKLKFIRVWKVTIGKTQMACSALISNWQLEVEEVALPQYAVQSRHAPTAYAVKLATP